MDGASPAAIEAVTTWQPSSRSAFRAYQRTATPRIVPSSANNVSDDTDVKCTTTATTTTTTTTTSTAAGAPLADHVSDVFVDARGNVLFFTTPYATTLLIHRCVVYVVIDTHLSA